MISVASDSVLWRMNGDFIERNAELSPNGRWMAYQSNESGAFEIYVRPFPNVEADQVQVSNNGGGIPLWSPDGSELFYLQPGAPVQLISVSVDTGATFAFGGREVVLEWLFRGRRWPHLRRVAGRPAVPRGEDAGRGRRGRGAGDHRRAELVRGDPAADGELRRGAPEGAPYSAANSSPTEISSVGPPWIGIHRSVSAALSVIGSGAPAASFHTSTTPRSGSMTQHSATPKCR